MATVFLSYRRSDTGGEAGRLTDVLQQKLGHKFVFRDVVSISPGDQFDSVLESKLASAKVFLVLIGPAWVDELKRRLTKGDIDYHRIEVATALRAGKRVMPLLLKGAQLPPPDALPEDLLALTKCQAITVRDEAWRTDLDRLIDAIGRPYRWHLLAIRVMMAVPIIVFAVWKLTPHIAPSRVSDYGFLRTEVLALIGIYGLLELFLGYRHFMTLKRLRRTA
jgi:hypothetical protein